MTKLGASFEPTANGEASHLLDPCGPEPAAAIDDGSCLLHLDCPGDRSLGVGVALAHHLDRLARDWHAELAFEQDRVDRAFGSSIHTLTEEL